MTASFRDNALSIFYFKNSARQKLFDSDVEEMLKSMDYEYFLQVRDAVLDWDYLSETSFVRRETN